MVARGTKICAYFGLLGQTQRAEQSRQHALLRGIALGPATTPHSYDAIS